MIKTYKLKVDTEKDCFICSKPGVAFNRESLELILTLTICKHHTETVKVALAKTDRQPGEDDE